MKNNSKNMRSTTRSSDSRNSNSRNPRSSGGARSFDSRNSDTRSSGTRNSDSRNSDTRSSGGTRSFDSRSARNSDTKFRGTREGTNSDYRKKFDDPEEGLRLEGRNAVLEALNGNRTIDKIFVKKGDIEGSIKVIIAKAREKGIVIQEVDKMKLDEMSQSRNHQGVIAACPAHEYVEVSDIINNARKKGEEPFIIILDNVKDPHNLGAIMRTAECAGAHGIIIPKRRAVGLTGIVSKTSAGAIEYVPVARVTNIVQAIEELKKEGIWIACGETHGRPYFKGELKGAVALVIGGEDEGVGKLISKKCDFSIKIPMYGEISSLNASVAAGLLMYEVVRQRNFLEVPVVITDK